MIASFETAGDGVIGRNAGIDILEGDAIDAGPPPSGETALRGGDDTLDGGYRNTDSV